MSSSASPDNKQDDSKKRAFEQNSGPVKKVKITENDKTKIKVDEEVVLMPITPPPTPAMKNYRKRPTEKGRSCGREESQEFSTTRGRSRSCGRKVPLKLKRNMVTYQQSSSQSSTIHQSKVVQATLSSEKISSMPPNHRSLAPKGSNVNFHVSGDDNSKNVDDAVIIIPQKSNSFVTHQNINKFCTDQNSLISNHHKIQDNGFVSCNKTSNALSGINSSDPATNIASDSLHPNEADSASSYNSENIVADTQESFNMTNAGQTSQCGSVSSESSGNSLNNTHSFLKILKPLKIAIDPCGLKRHYYGHVSSNIEEKVILLLGASGSGKTTLVNFVANFFEGVKTPDDEKVIIAPPSVKTKEMTAYTFCSVKDTDTVVTVIDTPGLNDSSGSEIRDHVTSLKTFLANAAANNLKIHALGFVAPAHIVRLTVSERLVMDYVSTLFGEGVKDNINIITLISFADVQVSPPIVEAMKKYGMNTKLFLKFNSSVLNGSSVEVDDIDRVYWRIGYKNWKKGMKLLKDLLPLPINVMKPLQREVNTKSVVDISVKHLSDGLIEFISNYDQGNLEATRSSSHKVWNMVTIVHHHLMHTPEAAASVEVLLVNSVKKVCCQVQLHNSSVYLKALSFYSLRGLDECAQAIISTIHPVYVSARNMQIAKTGESNVQYKKRKCDMNYFQEIVHGQELLFCHQCQDDHKMARLDETRIMDILKKTLGFKPNAIITFKCTECKCEGNVHGVNPMLNSEDIHGTFGSDVNRILHHTKNILSKLVKRHSLPNSNMTENDLLNFLMKEANAEANTFIYALLGI